MEVTCSCNKNYEGDGVTCNKIDECKAGTHNCDANTSLRLNLGQHEEVKNDQVPIHSSVTKVTKVTVSPAPKSQPQQRPQQLQPQQPLLPLLPLLQLRPLPQLQPQLPQPKQKQLQQFS